MSETLSDRKRGVAYLRDVVEDLIRTGKLRASNPNEVIERLREDKSERCSKIPKEERRYLKGSEITRWIMRHGVDDLCVGLKGGVFVPVSKIKETAFDNEEERFKDLEERRREYEQLANKEKKIFRPKLVTVNLGNYTEIKAPERIARVIESCIKNGPSNNRIISKISNLLGFDVAKRDWSNIDDNNPVLNFDVDVIKVNDSLKLAGVLMFFEMNDDEVNLIFEYMELMKKYGSLSKQARNVLLKKVFEVYGIDVSEEKFENLVAAFFIIGSVIGRNRDILMKFRKEYMNASNPEERMGVIRHLYMEMKFGYFSDTQLSLWQLVNAISRFGAFTSNTGKAGINNRSLKETLGKNKRAIGFRIKVSDDVLRQWQSEGIGDNMKRVIVAAELLHALYGIDLETAISIGKGLELMAMRTHGTFSGNASFLELFFKEKVFGNGRPMRSPTVSSDSIRTLRNFAERHVKKEDIIAYKKFIENYIRGEFGDEIEVYRVLNMGEGVIVGTRKIAEKYLSLITRTINAMNRKGKKVSRELMILKNVLQEIVMDNNLYGYTISTSYNKELVSKFAKWRAWTSKFLVKMKVRASDVIGGFICAPTKYLDDTELTILVPHDGIKYDVELVDVDLNNASKRVIQNYMLTKIFLTGGEPLDIDDDEWDDIVDKLLDGVARWTAQMLALNTDLDLTKDVYKRYWANILMAYPLMMLAVGRAVSGNNEERRKRFWEKAKAVFGKEETWRKIFMLQSSSRQIRGLAIEEAKYYRVPFTAKYVYGFKKVAQLFGHNFDEIVRAMEEAF